MKYISLSSLRLFWSPYGYPWFSWVLLLYPGFSWFTLSFFLDQSMVLIRRLGPCIVPIGYPWFSWGLLWFLWSSWFPFPFFLDPSEEKIGFLFPWVTLSCPRFSCVTLVSQKFPKFPGSIQGFYDKIDFLQPHWFSLGFPKLPWILNRIEIFVLFIVQVL